MATHVEYISDVSTTTTDDEWETQTDNGLDDDIPTLPPDDLSRIRTGDVSSLPLHMQCAPTQSCWISSTPCVPMWQVVVMIPNAVNALEGGLPMASPLDEPTCMTTMPATYSEDVEEKLFDSSSIPSNLSPDSRTCAYEPTSSPFASTAVSSQDEASAKGSSAALNSCVDGCRPCYNHIRGRCTNGHECSYCHSAIHAIRRKQRKHQRRAQAQAHRDTNDAALVDVNMLVSAKAPHLQDTDANVESKVICHAGNQHCGGQVGIRCQPCYRHIRGSCTQGARCTYCHDSVHTLRHKQKKQVRSGQRAAVRSAQQDAVSQKHAIPWCQALGCKSADASLLLARPV